MTPAGSAPSRRQRPRVAHRLGLGRVRLAGEAVPGGDGPYRLPNAGRLARGVGRQRVHEGADRLGCGGQGHRPVLAAPIGEGSAAALEGAHRLCAHGVAGGVQPGAQLLDHFGGHVGGEGKMREYVQISNSVVRGKWKLSGTMIHVRQCSQSSLHALRAVAQLGQAGMIFRANTDGWQGVTSATDTAADDPRPARTVRVVGEPVANPTPETRRLYAGTKQLAGKGAGQARGEDLPAFPGLLDCRGEHEAPARPGRHGAAQAVAWCVWPACWSTTATCQGGR